MRRAWTLVAVVWASALAAGGCGTASPVAPSPAAPVVAGISGLQAAPLAWACVSGALPCGPARVPASGGVGATPAAPGSLSALVSADVVTLAWDPPAGGDPPSSYVLEAGAAPGLADLARFDTGSAAVGLVVAAVPPATYFVRVRAATSAGVGPPSNEVTVVVGSAGPAPCAAAPNAPGAPVASATGDTLALSWAAPAGGCPSTSYRLEAGSGSGASDLANMDVGPSTSFTTSGVPAGMYYLRVRARNAAGTGPASPETVATVGGGETPGEPPVLSVAIVDLDGSYDPGTGRLGALDCTYRFGSDPSDRWCFHAFGSSASGHLSPSYDYKVAAGTMVRAATAGVVTRVDAETNPLYPGEFEVETRPSAGSSYLVIYDHVRGLAVSVGSTVAPGDALGVAGIHTSDPSIWGRVELQVNRITQRSPVIQSTPLCPRTFGTTAFNARHDAALAAHNAANPAFADVGVCLP
ncbi:MAG: fibronectin type III domain-containing protein [Vicinamibacterales bacterium]